MCSDRAIVGAGTSEAAWQRWPGLRALPCCSVDDIVPKGARLVVVAPHPDDEVLACGGLLAMAAQCGTEICVVGVTDGDASHPGSKRWPPERLAPARRSESSAGLKCLGLAPDVQRRLGLPDGRVGDHVAALTERLGAMLMASDVVVSTWELDGHPDHEASGRAAAAAAADCGARHLQAPVWMWHWAAPGDARVPWQRARCLPLPADVLRQKHAAIHAHVTQLEAQDTGAMPVLPPSALVRLLRPHETLFWPDAV